MKPASAEQDQARFFTQLREGFETARARMGEIVRDFRVAGTVVRLRFAGEALTSTMVPGLANPVFGGEEKPGCEIRLWDSESTGVPLAPPPRPRSDFTERGNIWGFDSLRYRSAYQWGEGSVNMMDRETALAVYWVPSHNHLPVWVLASPLRSILHWWMEMNGRQLVHAAAVGEDGVGVLIPGRGGSGKSSTALTCLLHGMDLVADDYLALALDPEPRVYRLYSTAKLDRRTLAAYPELARRCRVVDAPGFDKVVLFLEDAYRDRLRQSLPLKLVLRPCFSGVPETTLGSADAIDIEMALGSETLVHLPHSGAHTVEFLQRAAREIPRASIHLGTDRAGVVTGMREALKNLVSLSRQERDPRPFVSVIVHFGREDRENLRGMAAEVAAQRYPRTELIVMADGAAAAMADEVAALSGNVRFFSFPAAVVKAEAWNRGIRESIAELLLLLEPRDRLGANALESLVGACEADRGAAWARGAVAGPECEPLGLLRGALIRKNAFRECGLFRTDRFLQGREHWEWLQRAAEKGLTGREIKAVTLHPGEAVGQPRRLPHDVDLRFLRTELERRRGKIAE